MKCSECYWDFENKLWDTYSDCINLLSKRNIKQLIENKNFILNRRKEGE